MRKFALRVMVLSTLSLAFLAGCDGSTTRGAAQEPQTDTIAKVDPLPAKEVVKLEGDPLLNALARILAGLPLEDPEDYVKKISDLMLKAM